MLSELQCSDMLEFTIFPFNIYYMTTMHMAELEES